MGAASHRKMLHQSGGKAIKITPVLETHAEEVLRLVDDNKDCGMVDDMMVENHVKPLRSDEREQDVPLINDLREWLSHPWVDDPLAADF